MRVSSITVILAITALVSAPGLAISGNPAKNISPPGSDDFFVRTAQVPCINRAVNDRAVSDRTTGLRKMVLSRYVRCGNAVANTGRPSCIHAAGGLPIALLVSAAQFDTKTRQVDLKKRLPYLKARNISPARLMAGAGQVPCVNPTTSLSTASSVSPASSLSLGPLSQSARAGMAAAGGNGFLGTGAIFSLLGVTAGGVASVASLATDSAASAVSP